MRKTDKKREKNLRGVLNQVCELALEQVEGFVWLTHLVNYKSFPDSLNIICVFETDDELRLAQAKQDDVFMTDMIRQKLLDVGIRFNNIDRHITFDTEEACEREHKGNWNRRLA